jgi:hypothetical protein
MWTRYRFKTNAVKDSRPLVFNNKFPFWITGESDKDVTIVAFLPKTENLSIYWNDAFEIQSSEHEEIYFTERFNKPDYFIDST